MNKMKSAILLAALLASTLCAQEVTKVTRAQAVSAAIQKSEPVYPPLARQLKLEGSIQLEAVVLEDGTVDTVNIVSGHPILTRAGVEALKHWKFAPFHSGGKIVKALAPVTFDFKL